MDYKLFYIKREQILKNISALLNKTRGVLLVGDAGTGKTAISEAFIDAYGASYQIINSYTGMELEITKGAKVHVGSRPRKYRSLFVVDGLDEINDPEVKEKLFRIIERSAELDLDVLLISRPNSDCEKFRKYMSEYQTPAFTSFETELMIKKYFKESNEKLSGYLIKEIKKISAGNPSRIWMTLQMLSQGKGFDEINLLTTSEIAYKNNLLIEPECEGRIVGIEPHQLVTDVRVVNTSILDKIIQNPTTMQRISPREFEEMVAELFSREGYNVTLTKQSHDGGKDLFILEKRRIGKLLYYVECKRNAPNRPVGVNIIRELYGTVMADKVTAGIVVTSSYFSDPAREFTNKISHQMSLIDYVELNEWIKTIGS